MVVGAAGKAFKGSIDDMIRGGSKGSQAKITQYGSSGASAGSGGVLAGVRGLAQRPMTWANNLFARMPGPLSALGTNRFTVPVLGFTVSTGLALVLGYLAYRRYMM